jgi:hypothetical protein
MYSVHLMYWAGKGTELKYLLGKNQADPIKPIRSVFPDPIKFFAARFFPISKFWNVLPIRSHFSSDLIGYVIGSDDFYAPRSLKAKLKVFRVFLDFIKVHCNSKNYSNRKLKIIQSLSLSENDLTKPVFWALNFIDLIY